MSNRDTWKKRRKDNQAFKAKTGSVPINTSVPVTHILPPTSGRPRDHPWVTLPTGQRVRVKNGKYEYGFYSPADRIENILFRWYSTDYWFGQIKTHEIEPMRTELMDWTERHKDRMTGPEYHSLRDAIQGVGCEDPFESLLRQGYLSHREYKKGYIYFNKRGVGRAEQLARGKVSGEKRRR